MIDNNTTELTETQRLKQALAIVSGRLDVLLTRLQACDTRNHEVSLACRYAEASVRKSDEIFECLRTGEPIKP